MLNHLAFNINEIKSAYQYYRLKNSFFQKRFLENIVLLRKYYG